MVWETDSPEDTHEAGAVPTGGASVLSAVWGGDGAEGDEGESGIDTDRQSKGRTRTLLLSAL